VKFVRQITKERFDVFVTWTRLPSLQLELAKHLIDVDNNFVREFQTRGFDARIWELYLYAYLREENLWVDREFHAPDYLVERYGKKIAIEAVTLNPSAPVQLDIDISGPPRMRPQVEIDELLSNETPLRFASALSGKLLKVPPYWELPQAKGYPLVFAIADFHEPQSMTWSFPALVDYLYGVKHEVRKDDKGNSYIEPVTIQYFTKPNGTKIPAGFFFQDLSENVSAVLFSSTGTLSKFNRMGKIAGFGAPDTTMFRWGICHNHDPESILPCYFSFEVAPGKCSESWAEGLSMFHNPNAARPVPIELFPSIAHHKFEDGLIKSLLPEFHPYTSLTMHLMHKKSE